MRQYAGIRIADGRDPCEKQAAEILRQALSERLPAACIAEAADQREDLLEIRLTADGSFSDPDVFSIEETEGTLTLRAGGIRGLIYAAGRILRKGVFGPDGVHFVSALQGTYRPDKPIRGHQLGYRAISNTYDAWTPAQFKRYFTELMFFGMNIVEFIPYQDGASHRNALMQYDEEEMACTLSAVAHDLGLKVSVWMPNGEKDADEALKNRERFFSKMPYLDALFVPGGDPGDLPAAEMLSRTRAYANLLRRFHPDAECWPSAQQPHSQPTWGEEFLSYLETEKPAEFTGVITGPNAAFDIATLRRRLPDRYPIRFYPDVTHCLRCTHPVHYWADDWDYRFSAAFGRESICPRPYEYARLHKEISPFTIGSVTYSDGINDDVNKAVWCALEWAPGADVDTILEDYARLFFPGVPEKGAAEAIRLLEQNWGSPPVGDAVKEIEQTLSCWTASAFAERSADNWRYVQGLFRARCDCYIARKYAEESEVLNHYINILRSLPPEHPLMLPDYTPSRALLRLRKEIDADADRLFDLIGMQLSTSRHFASGWERGATLDTLDLPITDLSYLTGQVKALQSASPAEARRRLQAILDRCKAGPDEVYYSVALNELTGLHAAQEGEFYMDFQGDRPNVNNGTLPVCLQKLYDHLSLHAVFTGLSACDYTLTATYKLPKPYAGSRHTVTVNGQCIYSGSLFEVPVDRAYTDELLPAGFTALRYFVPAAAIADGSLQLTVEETPCGFEIAELRITKAR
ncbi:MAG: hypothetical protein IJK02_02185 [Clostridia bacterium]|nr:hypothetical protein [Clostridia bacterium]